MRFLYSVLLILFSYSSLASFSEDYPCISENYQENPRFSPTKLNYQIGEIKEYPNIVISISWEPEFYDGHLRIIGPASIKFLRKTDKKFFIIETYSLRRRIFSLSSNLFISRSISLQRFVFSTLLL